MRRILSVLALALCALTVSAQDKTVRLSFIETTDVHGNYFPYDFLNACAGSGSMARITTYVNAQRREKGDDRVVLLDNGDILQGQPPAYYYNFIDTRSTHLAPPFSISCATMPWLWVTTTLRPATACTTAG